MKEYYVRLGDGGLVQMEAAEIKRDIEEGTQDAARKGKISPMSESEIDQLVDIFTTPYKVLSVERGNEVILSTDGGTGAVGYMEEPSAGIPIGRPLMAKIWESVFCADTAELGHGDYSYKAVKPMVHVEQREMEEIQFSTVFPFWYGSMPNLGLYSQPDGPVPNFCELLPQGKIKEAREAQEEAIEHAVKDIVYVASALHESGADGIDLDTCGAAGDADFYAALRATEILKNKYPDMCIMVGMAGELVIGMHGEIEYDGIRLAGLPPHKQAKLVQKAGGTIFGPAINTNASKSQPWNLAKAVTYTKSCTDQLDIPVHTNVGMGVGGVPMYEIPAPDAVSRVSKALAEIGKLDGL